MAAHIILVPDSTQSSTMFQIHLVQKESHIGFQYYLMLGDARKWFQYCLDQIYFGIGFQYYLVDE